MENTNETTKTIKCLTIRYDKIGENRYLRTFQTDEKSLFAHKLNLGIVIAKNHSEIDSDLNNCKKILTA